jgi:hypothetical protein
MLPHEHERPGPTPIIRMDGADVTYHLWIARAYGECHLLVIRCGAHGDVFASIVNDREPCKNDTTAVGF